MATHRVGMREARENLRRLLDWVDAGDEVVLLRRGVEAARIVRPESQSPPFPDLSALRASIRRKGRPLSEDVIAARRARRF